MDRYSKRLSFLGGRQLAKVALLMLGSMFMPNVQALTVDVTLGEVDSQIQKALANAEGFELLLAQKVQEKLNAGNLDFVNGEAIVNLDIPTVDEYHSCADKRRYTFTDMKLTLKQTSGVNLSVTNINLPLDVGVKIDAILSGHIRGDLWWGKYWWFGWHCNVNHDVAYIDLHDTTLYSDLNLHLDLSAAQDGSNINVTVVSDFTSKDFHADVGHPVYTYSSWLLDFVAWLTDFENKVNNSIAKGFTDMEAYLAGLKPVVAAELDGTYTFAMPELVDVSQLAALVKAEPTLRQLLKDNQHEILYYLAINDKQALNNLLQGTAACAATSAFMETMPYVPLYHFGSGGVCEAADPNGADSGAYYSDSNCLSELAYKPTDYADYCADSLADKGRLGNAAAWTPDLNQANDPLPQVPTTKWTQYPGTAMNVNTESLAGNYQPYMKRINYKTIDNVTNADGSVRGNGVCKLEMRVYKRDPNATNQKAVLDFHGGSWASRGPFAGLEAHISQMTERGYVVFAPFYRLAGEDGGNVECNGVTATEVTADVNDALDWVLQHGEALGVDLQRGVDVTGQSAGGHLSLWLVTHRPESIHKGLLLYPPSDALDFAQKAVIGGEYENWIYRLSILTNFFGVNDLSEVPYQDMADNSFHNMVNAVTTPPVYILHGTWDTWLPSQQSVLLCNAYGGSAVNDGGDQSLGDYRRIYDCGTSGSQLHLFAGAGHVMDLSCMPGISCPSGSPEASMAIAESLGLARDWMMAD